MGFWSLLEWYNLPFVLPFSAALLYLLSSSFGFGGGEYGESDADVHADIDSGGDIADAHAVEGIHAVESIHAAEGVHALEHDMSSGIGHDFTVAHGAAMDDHGIGLKALSLLGFGRVPVSIILMTFCFLWGFAGLATNIMIGDLPWMSKLFFIPSGIIAWCTATAGTSVLAKAFAKVMPSTETYAVSLSELAGQIAEVRYNITEESGTAMLYDRFGTFQEVECRRAPNASDIPADTSVLLLRFDAQKGAFIVKEDSLGFSPRQPKLR